MRASIATLALVGSVVFGAETLSAQDANRGKAVYEKWCLECHGETGEGNGQGAKFMLPPPRNFVQAQYQIRSTASGELPTDADILRIVDEGMPNTAMPEWKSKLTSTERQDVVAYVKKFSSFFEGAAPTALSFGSAPSSNIEEGRKTFEKLECFKCHGVAGRGDGKSSPTLKDDNNAPIRAADLTENWNFNGGGTVEDIYHRLRTGLDGTPMPSFAEVIDSKIITDEQLWNVAQYVRSLSPEEAPKVQEVFRAAIAKGPLPASASDTSWNAVSATFVPLVGQIIEKPRWFMPSVDGVWVRAMHNDTTLALQISWTDRSQSPAPAWEEWLGRVKGVATDIDGAIPTKQGPDRLWLQFPRVITNDDSRPYFLGGDSKKPVHLWRWTSNPDAVEEGTGKGLGKFAAASSTEVKHSAVYENGQWRLQFTRSLVPADSTTAPGFHPGIAIPVAFFAADGSNGETENRGSVSAWYYVYLDTPTPPTVYVVPVVAVLLTAGLCYMAVWRAQQQRGRTARR